MWDFGRSSAPARDLHPSFPNDQLAAQKNSRFEEPARGPTPAPDRAADQRDRSASPGGAGRFLRQRTSEWKERVSAIEEHAERAGRAGGDPARGVRGGEERRPAALRARRGRSATSRITWDMVHFDVQLIGGIVLHRGKIAEMATGEGKTLVATLPLYLNALTGRGVHLVTVNDYLARRDAEWMGQLYRFLGLTVGCIQHDQDPASRREQYHCDITYGTNSEFGFDYLRDNGMATTQRAAGAARPLLRHRRRGGLHPDRRGAHAADHHRPGRRSRTHQYDRFKPLVEQLVRKQTLALQPPRQRGQGTARARARPRRPAALLFKVKLGQPRNKGLLHMHGGSRDCRKLIDKRGAVSSIRTRARRSSSRSRRSCSSPSTSAQHERRSHRAGPRASSTRTIPTPSCCRT